MKPIHQTPSKLFTILLLPGLLLISQTIQSVEPLAVETVIKTSIADSLTFDGTVEAVNKGTASAQTSGRVVEALFDVGDLVEKDDIMLRLRDTQQAAELEAAEAGIKSAMAQNLAAEKEYKRADDVFSKRLISRSVLDQALAKRDETRAALDAAKARLKNAKEQLEYTRIRAPYSGIVLQRHVEVGETVNPGVPVYTGMSLESMRVVADVPQKDIDQIRHFQKAQVILPNGDLLKIEGENLTFFGYADPNTSTFKVRVRLPQGVEGLYPGMYLKTSFQIGNREILSVSPSSIVHRGEVTAVYVKQKTALNFRQIRLGKQFDNETVEILSGLKQGEKIITDPAEARQKKHVLNSSDSLETDGDNNE